MTLLAYKDNQPILYVHIPKTAGTSIGDWMVNNVGGEYYLHNHNGGQHANISRLKKLLGGKKVKYDNLYMFTVVRNPWDRLLSGYLYYARTGRYKVDELSFETFLSGAWKKDLGTLGNPMVSYLSEDRPQLILRFENLEKDFEQVQELFGCNEPLPVKNTTKHDHYSKHYNDVTRKLVEERFKDDIEYFGYTFEEI